MKLTITIDADTATDSVTLNRILDAIRGVTPVAPVPVPTPVTPVTKLAVVKHEEPAKVEAKPAEPEANPPVLTTDLEGFESKVIEKPRRGRRTTTVEPAAPAPAPAEPQPQPAPIEPEAKPEPQPAPVEPEAKPEPVQPAADPAPAVTLDYARDIRPLVIRLVQVTSQEEVLNFLKTKFGVASAMKIDPAQFETAKRMFEEAIATHTNED